jgi:hypothetical protein
MDDDKPSDADLVIGTPSRILLVIKPDGRLIYGPDYTPDEAAKVFWTRFSRVRAEAYRRELNLRRDLQENNLLAKLLDAGNADIFCQVTREREEELQRMKLARGSAWTPAEQATLLQAHLDARAAEAAVERAATSLVEVGRALAIAALPEDPVSEGPPESSSGSLN